MDGIARVDHRLDLVGASVDQGDLAGIAQRDREQVVDVDVVHLLGRPVLGLHENLPAAIISGMPHSGGAGGSSSR